MSQLADLVKTVRVHGYKYGLTDEQKADLLEDIISDLEWDILEDGLSWDEMLVQQKVECLKLIKGE